MLQKCIGILKDEHGQGTVEYGLIIALMAVAVIFGLTKLGKVTAEKFLGVGDEIQNAKPIE